MKWGITGAGGMLALDLQEVLKSTERKWIAWGRSELDIVNMESVRNALTQEKPDVVVNCAAFTKVDEAEVRQTEALEVNVTGAKNLAKICADLKIKLIHLSTDFVFDGNSNSPYAVHAESNPINFYGRSKRDGELAVLQAADQNLVLRVSWLYGKHGTNFVKTMLKLATTQKTLKVVSDQQGSPTWTMDASHALTKLAERNACGIFHYSNTGICSWYEFASKIFLKADEVGLIQDIPQIQPIPTTEYPTLAKRPVFSALDTSAYYTLCQEQPPFWKDSLAQALPSFSTPST